MNLIDSFNNFYNSLSTIGVLFFWVAIFLFVFLIILTIILVKKNKKLVEELKEIEKESIEENVSIISQNEKIESENKEELLPVIEVEKEEIITPKIEIQEEILPVIKKQKKQNKEKEVTGPYKKNVLREMNARMQTSPIRIENKEKAIEKEENINDYTTKDEEEFLSITSKEEISVSPLEMMEDTYEVNENMKFASEIVEKMEEEIKPSNIELTDYEKKQEEEAIISYDELLKVKDKIYNITEDEETEDFIDELKSFRLDLQ